MKFLVSGGGTGGHFFPALEIIKRARDRKKETVFIGSERGIEKKFQYNIPGEKIFLNVQPFTGFSPISRIKTLLGYISGALSLNSRIGEDFKTLIFGGYPTVPAGIFTILKRKPLYIHEQNSVPSRTNRLFFLFCKKTFIAFEHTRKFFKGEHVIKTGIPIREEVKNTSVKKDTAKLTLGFSSKSPVFLFFGGSQGSKFINTLAVDFARKTKANVILLSGHKDHDRVSKLAENLSNMRIYPFRTDIGLIYSASDVAVCRAGASTIAELSYFGIPAVFIPYPYATDDHQFFNAKEIEDLGGGFVIRQEEANPEKVIKLVDKIVGNLNVMSENIRKFNNPEATELILKEIFEE